MIISHTTTTATNDYVEHCNDMDFKWKGGIDGWMDGLIDCDDMGESCGMKEGEMYTVMK